MKEMKKKYIKPLCTIHKVEVECPLLGGSVTMGRVPGAQQENWEDSQNHYSGAGIGDGSDVNNY